MYNTENAYDIIFSTLPFPFILFNFLKESWQIWNKNNNKEYEATDKFVIIDFNVKWKI